jgi:hypothetical protein
LLLHLRQLICLPFEVLLAGVLPSVVLPVLVEEMVLAVPGLLEEKGKIPPGLETPEEEEELPLSGALLQS